MRSDLGALLQSLTPRERAELDRLLTGYTPPLWTPFPGPQATAFRTEADITGYGGAAGGGKTDLLLGLAAILHRRSIIFRREAVQVRAIADRARELFAGKGSFNLNTGIWSGLPGGRQLELAGVKDPGDEHKYRGRPHDFIGFDEADQFTEAQVRFLLGWLRTTDPAQRCRCVICFNPPSSAEGRWLIAFFGPWLDRKHPHPAVPGELRWYATLPSGKEEERPDGEPFTACGEVIRPRSRTFFPARVQDNPALVATDYVATLQALPEPLRSQLLYGDMDAGVEDDPWQVIPTAWAEAAVRRWEPGPPEGFSLSCLGVDVARGGKDKTVLSARYGNWFAPLIKHPGSATPDGPLAAARVQAVHGGEAPIHVDVIGIGSSVYDCLKEHLGKLVVPVNNAESSQARDRSGRYRLVNVRAASYWALREALDPEHGCGPALPPDNELLADLTAPRYSVTTQGIKVEPKDDVSKRIGRSPDCGDALVLAHWQPPRREFKVWI